MFNEHAEAPEIALLNSRLERLEKQNAEYAKDIEAIAGGIHKALKELNMLNPSGELEVNMRKIMQLLPDITNGGLSKKLAFLSDLLPLVDKYKHLAK